MKEIGRRDQQILALDIHFLQRLTLIILLTTFLPWMSACEKARVATKLRLS